MVKKKVTGIERTEDKPTGPSHLDTPEKSKLFDLNFKVSFDFRTDFRTEAATLNITQRELLERAYAAYIQVKSKR